MLYHITTASEWAEIRKEGLKPRIGKWSEMVKEEDPHIFLCQRRDVPYWRILLNKEDPVLLSVDVEGTQENTFQYDGYSEVLVDKGIPADRIHRAKWPKQTTEQMEWLCESYLHTISHCTSALAKFYTGNRAGYTKEDMEMYLLSCLAGLPNLDYSVMGKERIRAILKSAGRDGEFTFLDLYDDTKDRLYQMLLKYPTDGLENLRAQLYKVIKKNFSGCLRVNTGGWTN